MIKLAVILTLILVLISPFLTTSAQDSSDEVSLIGFWALAGTDNGWLFREDNTGAFIESNSGNEPVEFQYQMDDDPLLYVYHPTTTNIFQILLWNDEVLVLRDLVYVRTYTLIRPASELVKTPLSADQLIGAWYTENENSRFEFNAIDQVELGYYGSEGTQSLGMATYSIQDGIAILAVKDRRLEITAYLISEYVIIAEWNDVDNSSKNRTTLIREFDFTQFDSATDFVGVWESYVSQELGDSVIGFSSNQSGLVEFSQDGQITASIPSTLTGTYQIDENRLHIQRFSNHDYADVTTIEYELASMSADVVIAHSRIAPTNFVVLIRWQNLPTPSENTSIVGSWTSPANYIIFLPDGTRQYRVIENLTPEEGGTYEVAGNSLVHTYEALEGVYNTEIFTIERLDTFFLILNSEGNVRVYSRIQPIP